jgi:hypothetical protein
MCAASVPFHRDDVVAAKAKARVAGQRDPAVSRAAAAAAAVAAEAVTGLVEIEAVTAARL